MKKNVAIAWACNLRNSKIKKCVGSLGQFEEAASGLPDTKLEMVCVLGMLCVTVNQIRKKQKKRLFPVDYSEFYLSKEIADFAGLNTCDGGYRNDHHEYRSLLRDNDTGHCFKRMAKTILKYQKEL